MIRIVISGPNCTEGGILFVMKDLLKEIVKYDEFEIIALIHSKSLFEESEYKNIEFIEFPNLKKSWFNRIYYEYKEFHNLSLKLKANIWLSMHDMTPNVETEFLATYCHNSSPFYKFRFRDFLYDKKFGLFTLFYKYLYKINIKKNDYLFVQQNWIKDEFEKIFHINNVIVAKPDIKVKIQEIKSKKNDSSVFNFFYPAFPRVFKNFEVICKAVEFLVHELNMYNFNVYLTIGGTENKYAYDIVKKYRNNKNIHFIGLLPREKVFEYYELGDVLIFPSKLETWGLPISEFQEYNKSMIVADLPYAKETVGNYDKVNFFKPNDYKELAKIMKAHINKNVSYDGNQYDTSSNIVGWNQFIEFLKIKYLEKINE